MQSIVPGFSLTPDNITSVLNICSRLDGLPLGLELASARCNVLTPQQIAERLDDRFGLLTYSPTSGSDPRHGTMQAAIDWSYDLLAMPEQILLRRLAVFAGGYSLAVVEKVCSGDGIEQQQIFELLASLVNKSLVGAQTLQRQEARYFLLETIREYARRKLLEAVEGEKLRNRHLHSYLELVEDAATRLSGPYQHLWLKWLDDEYDNIRLALSWSLESRQVEAG